MLVSSVRPDVYATFSKACQDLTPVVVDLGPVAPRLETYCDSIVEIDGAPALVLRPIAADAIPIVPGPAQILSRDEDMPFVLGVTRISRYAADAALVPLVRAQLSPMARRKRPRATARRALAAVVPAIADDLAVHAFPVANIGAEWCAIDTPFGLAPGTDLEVIEIVSGQRVLRRSAGTVVESIPYRMPHGEAAYRCRIVFRTDNVRGKRHDVISQASALRSALQYAATLRVPLTLTAAGREPIDAQILSVDAAEMRLAMHALPAAFPDTGALLSIHFELFTEQYESEVRLLSRSGTTAHVTLPLVLRRRHRRHEARAAVPNRGMVELRFDSPITGETARRNVLDLSFGGLCFATEPSDVAWRDLPLANASLVWNGRTIPVDGARIRGVSGNHAHVGLERQDTSGDVDMIDLVAFLRHPALVADDGSRFDAVMSLQRDVGAVGGYIGVNLARQYDEARDTWRRMHARASDVCRTIVCEEEGAVVASVTAVRTHEHAWFPCQMAAARDRRWRSPAGLDLAYTDHIVLRPDAHYSVMIVKVGNVRQTEFVGGFLERTGTPEVGLRRTVDWWRGTDQRPTGVMPRGLRVRRMRASDEALVARAAARTYSGLHAASLSMVPGELTLPDTSKRFRRAGLRRGRKCFIVQRGRTPILALLCEHSSPGMHLGGFLSATWIVPLHPDPQPGGDAWRAAAEHLVRTREATPGGDRYLLVPADADAATLADAGFHREFPLHLYAYNRAGTQRWYDYVHQLRGDWMASKQEQTGDGVSRVRHIRAS